MGANPKFAGGKRLAEIVVCNKGFDDSEMLDTTIERVIDFPWFKTEGS